MKRRIRKSGIPRGEMGKPPDSTLLGSRVESHEFVIAKYEFVLLELERARRPLKRSHADRSSRETSRAFTASLCVFGSCTSGISVYPLYYYRKER